MKTALLNCDHVEILDKQWSLHTLTEASEYWNIKLLLGSIDCAKHGNMKRSLF